MDEVRARFTPKERALGITLALYTAAAMLFLTPVRGALGQASQADMPPPPAAVIASPSDQPPVAVIAEPPGGQPGISAGSGPDYERTARSIVTADTSLAQALGGTSHTILKSGPWTTNGTDASPSRLLGTAFVIAPVKPIALQSVALPGVLYDQTERDATPYQSIVNTVSATNVTELLVLVDLKRRRVVNITPGPDTENLRSVAPAGFLRSVPMPDDGGR